MDRALKERTIGAVVLVAFAVLIVPVFLDGPSNDAAVVSQSVTLPGQNDQPRTQQTIVLERDRKEPLPAARTPSVPPGPQPAKPDPSPARMPDPVVAQTTIAPAQKTPAEPAPAKPAAAEPKKSSATAPSTASATGMWAVQLGSFSNRGNAERLAASLRDDGYAAFLSRLETGSGELLRVRIGPQQGREAAETIAARLGSAGHKGQVVPHP